MFERLHTPDDIFTFKLGAALKMESEILGMLDELEENAQRQDIRSALREHASETRQHVANLERAFQALGEEPDQSPCPAIEGLAAEGKATLKKTDDALADIVILSAAAETEHHEIAVYEGLITQAQARGRSDVVDLLRQNLESEKQTLAHVQQSSEQIAREAVPA